VVLAAVIVYITLFFVLRCAVGCVVPEFWKPKSLFSKSSLETCKPSLEKTIRIGIFLAYTGCPCNPYPFFIAHIRKKGHAVPQLFEALRYKPRNRGFDSGWCHWTFKLTSCFQQHCGPRIDSASNRTTRCISWG